VASLSARQLTLCEGLQALKAIAGPPPDLDPARGFREYGDCPVKATKSAHTGASNPPHQKKFIKTTQTLEDFRKHLLLLPISRAKRRDGKTTGEKQCALPER
jgi:hypothetical protein